MTRWLWLLLRFSLAAWIGAATLFVVTGVREVTSPLFESLTKNQLAALRFPSYYLFGFVLISVAVASAVGLVLTKAGSGRLKLATGLIAAALVVMIVDYRAVYLPLEAMMLIPDAAKPPEFRQYHEWSKQINFLSLGLCLAAVIPAFLEPPRGRSVE